MQHLAGKVAQRPGPPEADGEPRGVGGKAEDEDARIGREFRRGGAAPPGDVGQVRFQFPRLGFLVGRVQRPHEHLLDGAGIAPLRRLGPEHHRRIADAQVVPRAPGQQRIERRAIGEGGGFGDRRVLALRLAVGGEGIEVERDQRGARALCSGDALDGRVKPGDGSLLTAHEATRAGSFPFLAEERLGRRPLMDEAALPVHLVALEPEDEVDVEQIRVEATLDEHPGPPRPDETEKGAEARILAAGQKRLMGFDEGAVFPAGPVIDQRHRMAVLQQGLSPVVLRCGHSESIGRLVPQSVGLDARSALEGRRHRHHPRLKAALPVRRAQIVDRQHAALTIEHHLAADLLDRIAGRRGLTLGPQALVKAGEFGKNGHRTSPSSRARATSSTPSSSLARKNIGRRPFAKSMS